MSKTDENWAFSVQLSWVELSWVCRCEHGFTAAEAEAARDPSALISAFDPSISGAGRAGPRGLQFVSAQSLPR